MNSLARWLRPEWAVTAFALWRSMVLVEGWRHAPLERAAWVMFLVWLLPLAVFIGRASGTPANQESARPIWPFIPALFLTLVGTLGSLNALCYVGLAFALVGLTGWSWMHWLWLASAVSWMPVFGWLAQGLGLNLLFALRLAVAVAGVGIAFRWILPRTSPS
jgi:hypothetical protein